MLNAHPRLYRSLSFGDPDYPDATFSILGQLLTEATEPHSGEAGRMELLADSMPELPDWVIDNAPVRTKRLFTTYLAERDASEIPSVWKSVDESKETDALPPLAGTADSDPLVNECARDQKGLLIRWALQPKPRPLKPRSLMISGPFLSCMDMTFPR